MANKWITHIKKTMRTMKSKGTYKKGLGLKQVITEAKKTWKKHGGADTTVAAPSQVEEEETPPMVTAGRKRRGCKTKRGGRR